MRWISTITALGAFQLLLPDADRILDAARWDDPLQGLILDAIAQRNHAAHPTLSKTMPKSFDAFSADISKREAPPVSNKRSMPRMFAFPSASTARADRRAAA